MYAVTIVAAGGDPIRERPLVLEATNPRVPTASVGLQVAISPSAPPNTPVRWQSPDGKNDIGATFFANNIGPAFDAKVSETVGIYKHDAARGEALIVADVGAPVNARARITVMEGQGIGFGCYGFMYPSIRFAPDGTPQAVSLAQSDVAVRGPGNRAGVGPGYGCWADNYDERATSYRLVFNHGGRLGPGGPFTRVLSYDDVAGAGTLDVLTADGSIVRIHLSAAGGTYFTGWLEVVPKSP